MVATLPVPTQKFYGSLTCSPAVGAGAEVDYTGIDDYNSVNGSEDEEEEVDRELEEVDVSDLQVEEVC